MTAAIAPINIVDEASKETDMDAEVIVSLAVCIPYGAACIALALVGKLGRLARSESKEQLMPLIECDQTFYSF